MIASRPLKCNPKDQNDTSSRKLAIASRETEKSLNGIEPRQPNMRNGRGRVPLADKSNLTAAASQEKPTGKVAAREMTSRPCVRLTPIVKGTNNNALNSKKSTVPIKCEAKIQIKGNNVSTSRASASPTFVVREPLKSKIHQNTKITPSHDKSHDGTAGSKPLSLPQDGTLLVHLEELGCKQEDCNSESATTSVAENLDEEDEAYFNLCIAPHLRPSNASKISSLPSHPKTMEYLKLSAKLNDECSYNIISESEHEKFKKYINKVPRKYAPRLI